MEYLVSSVISIVYCKFLIDDKKFASNLLNLRERRNGEVREGAKLTLGISQFNHIIRESTLVPHTTMVSTGS